MTAPKRTIMDLPLDCLVEIMKNLSYEEARNFRAAHKSIDEVYSSHRKEMKGPFNTVAVQVMNNKIKFDARIKGIGNEWTTIATEDVEKSDILINSTCNITIVESERAQERTFGHQKLQSIFNKLKTCQFKRVTLKTFILNAEILQSLDSVACETFEILATDLEGLIDRRFTRITRLYVSNHLSYDQMESVMMMSDMRKLHVRTEVRVPQLLHRVMTEWKNNRKIIESWCILNLDRHIRPIDTIAPYRRLIKQPNTGKAMMVSVSASENYTVIKMKAANRREATV